MKKIKRLSGGAARKKGKKLNQQLQAIYKLNKEKIDAAIQLPAGDRRRKSTIFKNYVKDIMEVQNMGLNKALDKFENSRIFTSAEQAYKENLLKSIKTNELEYEFRKRRGWNKKFDMDKLQFVSKDDKITTYRYENVFIFVSDSPEEETGSNISFGLADAEES